MDAVRCQYLDALDVPFLVADVAALRRKIAGLQGVWKRRWAHFLACAEADAYCGRSAIGSSNSLGVPTYPAFAYVATGEPRWAAKAARTLRAFRDGYDEIIRSSPQHDWDTWCYAAPRMRHAIMLDWIWDSGELTSEERGPLADLFVEDSLRYPYVVLHHRIPPHANNQGTAQALNLVTVGYLFGVKRGNDARARHLLEFGLGHLLQQVALAPPGGHIGEGSTYQTGVEAPLLALACATLEWITGESFLDREFAPSGNTFRGMLAILPKLIPPSQILAGWDEHGYQLAMAGTPLAFMAGRTGDRAYYDPATRGDLWELSGHFAWMRDDHVWQWIFMPAPEETRERCPHYPHPWAEAHVGGTLLDRGGARHLFQYWDVSTNWPARQHMNPNNVQLEAWGSLLTLDGKRTDTFDFPLSRDPRMQFGSWHQADSEPSSWSAGCVAAHSCVWIDDAIDIVVPGRAYESAPDRVTTGQLVRHELSDDLQLVTGEVAQFYDHRFTDLKSMRRTSALVDNMFWVMVDQIDADREHAFTSQLVLRTDAQRTDTGVRVRTPEHVVLDVIPVRADGPDKRDELVDVPGYPSSLEQRCAQYRRVRSGREVEFVNVLVPQLARRELADLTEGWSGKWASENRGEAAGWHQPGGKDDWPAMAFADIFLDGVANDLRNAPDKDPTLAWMARAVQGTVPEAGQRLLLQLPRGGQLDLWLDGTPLPSPCACTSHDAWHRIEPAFVDVTDQLGDGKPHELVLRAQPQNRFGLLAPCKLHITVAVPDPVVQWTPDGVITVAIGGTSHTVTLDRLRCDIPARRQPRWSGEDPAAAARDSADTILAAAPPSDPPAWDGSRRERCEACLLALKHPDPGSHDRLVHALDDEDWVVRMMAARVVGDLKIAKAVPKLIEIVEQETPDKRGDPGYLPKYRLREMALYALGKIGDPSAMAACAACMAKDEFYGVHRLAATALEVIGDESVIPVLKPWTTVMDPETAGACERAIAAIERKWTALGTR